MDTTQSKFYFPQLDGLRFFAFFLVFIHHFDSISSFFQPDGWLSHSTAILKNFGWIGVDIFLCLSSFLLTALLIQEHQKTNTISIKKFFFRRALRIWPLYYLIIFLAFFIFPIFHLFTPKFHSVFYHDFLSQHFLPFSIFLGNLSYAYFTNSLTVAISPLWTISLEEQFYIIWPILLFILLSRRKKWFFITITSMIILSALVRIYIIKNNLPYPIIWVFSLGRLDAFALGALLAYIYIHHSFSTFPIIAIICSLILFKIVVSSTGIGAPNTIWQLFVVDLASTLLIYASLYSKKISYLLAIKPLPWLGKISFGLYIFHDLMIQITNNYILPLLARHINLPTSSLIKWWIAFFIIIMLTILCASISYYYYEKPFLKLKDRFTIIQSRKI